MLRKNLKKFPILFLSTAVIVSSFAFNTPAFAASETKLSGTATASTYDTSNNCIADNAMDGDATTRWAGKDAGAWLKIDLGSEKTVSSIAINWYSGDVRKTTFEVKTSQDGANWTTVIEKRESDGSATAETYDFTDTKARYVEIIGYGNTINTWNSINELEIYGTGSATTATAAATKAATTAATTTATTAATTAVTTAATTTATKATTASATDVGSNIAAANGMDGNANTHWAGNGEGAWLKLDLGSSKKVSSASVDWFKGDTRKTTFEIQTSEDNTNWTTVVPKRRSDGSATAEMYDFPDVTARYVEIIGYGNTVDTWNAINEFQAYSNPASAKLPSQVLDLKNWKITIPINNEEGKAKEIKQPDLATFESSNFYVNSTGDGVVFNANCASPTTAHSSYPRSELREMTDDGKTNASWTTDSGTHTLIVEGKITHVPDVKQHVVIGQIHDASDDVIEVRLEKNRFFVQANGTDVGTLDDNYKLGTKYTVKVVAEKGVIQVYYNDVLKVSYNKVTSGCYFKAGMYTQSNTTKGDLPTAFGESVIYNVQVSHK